MQNYSTHIVYQSYLKSNLLTLLHCAKCHSWGRAWCFCCWINSVKFNNNALHGHHGWCMLFLASFRLYIWHWNNTKRIKFNVYFHWTIQEIKCWEIYKYKLWQIKDKCQDDKNIHQLGDSPVCSCHKTNKKGLINILFIWRRL